MHNNLEKPDEENVVYIYVRDKCGGYSSHQTMIGHDSFVFAWKFHLTKSKRLKNIDPSEDPLKRFS